MIKIWDSNDFSLKSTLTGHNGPVSAMVLLKNGFIASAGDDKVVRTWDSEAKLNVQNFTQHTEWITSLTVLDDGDLISSSYDLTIWKWKINQNNL